MFCKPAICGLGVLQITHLHHILVVLVINVYISAVRGLQKYTLILVKTLTKILFPLDKKE